VLGVGGSNAGLGSRVGSGRSGGRGCVLGVGVQGSGFRVQGSGFGNKGSGLGSGIQVYLAHKKQP